MLKPKVKTHPCLICSVYFVFLMPPLLKSKACQIRLQNTHNVTSSSRVYHYHPWPSQHYHSAKLLHPGWAWPVHLLPWFCVCVLSHSVVSNSLWPHGLQLTRLRCPYSSPGKNTGVDSHSLVQGIFPTQVSNPSLICKQILYPLSHQGSPGFHACPPQMHSSDGSQSDF